ncbi:MAG: RNA polymerase factor sigma-54 [Planctomycetota bacterium]|nr:RNA polymerase factor sigma-54 [Planctomycetota bacterium]
MRFDTSQQMRLGQQMKLAPRMIQSMEILQMPLADLQERIEQELESNPTLELTENEADEREVREARVEAERDARALERPADIDEQHGTRDFERLDAFENDNPDAAENEFSERPDEQWGSGSASADTYREQSYSAPRQDGERDAKMDAMAAAPARSASLTDQLLEQWALTEVDAKLRPLGELIISNLESDGYLRTPLETIAERAPLGADGQRPSVEQLGRALQALQLFLDPPGVAARDARECLLLQLDALLDDSGEAGEHDDKRWLADASVIEDARVLVRDHLDDLMQNRLPRIAERAGLTLERIRGALELMKKLSLAPARRLVSDDVRPIVPDAIVEYDAEADRYVAYLNEPRMMNLRVNMEYAKLSRDRTTPDKDREFLRTNLGNAQWLIDAVNQRKGTLLRVINVVVQEQREYFDFGPQALKPLPMTQVADQLGIHVATVSRAVAEKYIATPRGTIALRKFFSGGVQTDGGEEVAWDAIKVALREIVDGEDKKRPLSDEALVDELKKRGIEIARRTVAKYRDQLQIPAARLRKTF